MESMGYWDNAMIRPQSGPLTQSAGFDSCHVGMTISGAVVNLAQPRIETSAKLRQQMEHCSREEVKGHGAIQVCEVWENVVQSWELLWGAHEGGQVIGVVWEIYNALLDGGSSRVRTNWEGYTRRFTESDQAVTIVSSSSSIASSFDLAAKCASRYDSRYPQRSGLHGCGSDFAPEFPDGAHDIVTAAKQRHVIFK